MHDERFDGFFMQVAQQAGGIDNILDAFFGFLNRKTDFFSGAEEGKARSLVNVHLEKWMVEGRKKREEDKEKHLAADKARKQLEQKKKEAAEREWAEKQAAKKVEDRITEVVEEPAVPEKKEEEAPAQDTSTEEKKADEEDDGPPPVGNGGTNEFYTWTQTLATVEVFVPVKPGTKAKQLTIDITGSKMKVGMKGEAPLFEGSLHAKIKADDTMWLIEDSQLVHITLEKFDGMAWWPTVVKGHPEIDTKKIVPENSKLSDLDGETRQTVEKMMYDQRAKAAGKPTSDEKKQHDMLEKFKKAHPEMDFSNAKINYGGGGGDFNFPNM